MSAPRRLARVGESGFAVSTDGHLVTVTPSDGTPASAITTHYLGHGRMFLVEGDERRLAWVVEDADRRWVYCDGEVTLVEIEREAAPRRRGGGAPGHETLAAPMPATVVRILAPAGTAVQRGAVILLLEAMKMELPLRAPYDAVITAVHCREGELVQPNTTLIELEAQ